MSEWSVVIGTFGTSAWSDMAKLRAIPSAEQQTKNCEIIHVHGDTLAQARNEGVKRATGVNLVFLDADDELDPRYIEFMDKVMTDLSLVQPSTLGVVDGKEDPYPVLITRKPLLEGNFLIIGSAVSKLMFQQVGGFRELSAWEDWDLWIRCWLEGATIDACPEAIYRVHVRPGSRNDIPQHLASRLYQQIRSEHGPTAIAKGLA